MGGVGYNTSDLMNVGNQRPQGGGGGAQASAMGGCPQAWTQMDGSCKPPGGGGSGSGGGAGQPTFNANTQKNPQLDAMYGAWGDYRNSLAKGNDQDAINAMQRQRDLATGGAKEFQAMAGARGLGPDSGATQLLMQRGLAQGARNATGLNASMTSDARKQQMAALSGQTGAAEAGAGNQLGQQNFALNAWQAQQNAAQQQAQLQAMQDQNQFQNQMSLLKFYSG